MRRTPLYVMLFLAPLLLAGAAEKESCPLGPFNLLSPRDADRARWHQLSATTELVASAMPGERRRPSTPAEGVHPPMPPAVNFIDTDLFGAMQKAGIVPTAVAGDEEFLRRVTLDLTGAIPDPATVQAFVADTTPGKRAKMIDQLLASDAFVDRWTMWYGDLVQNVQTSANSREFPQGRNAYYMYIHDSIKAAKPYDQMAREVISGKGVSFTSTTGNANYWVRQIQPNGPIQDTYDNLSAQSGAQFLGMPFLCLSCHNGLGHLELVNQYLKSHTRYDFWGNAAFFARTRAMRVAVTGSTNDQYDVEDNSTGSYQLDTTSGNKTPRQPINGQSTVSPAFLLTGEGPRPGEPWRDAYGRILTAHPQFARAAVNYLWKEMFGMGIVEPVGSFDLNRLDPNNLPPGQTVQPTNPTLLTDLANAFVAGGYDLRSILRTVANSSAYQLSTTYTAGTWNESWTPYFARHIAHRLTAEEMLDAITKSTNVPNTYAVSGGLPAVTKAMQLPDTLEARNTPYGRFLDELGRGNRDDQARTNDSSVAQALSLMNDSTIVVSRIHNAKVGSTVNKVLTATKDPGTIVDQIYLATLSRRPTAAERQSGIAFLNGGILANRAEDLQWVLLNRLEFLFD